jgi:glycosyltransferase involved in cell wall biosynthesis
MPIHIAAVIPAFNVGKVIDQVLSAMPEMIRTVVVVDDGSTDDTAAVVEEHARRNARIQLIRHDRNQGVGAAMVTGFRRTLELEADIVVKIDGDGQMPLSLLPRLVAPLINGEADYVKGNRFRDFQAIRRMPPLRRLGNVGLSFLAKAATGYWQCFDPTNGYVAIRGDVLAQVSLNRIDPSYYFEISMLSQLYLLGAVVLEEPMQAHYNGEPSSLSIPRVLMLFPGRLLSSLVRRIFLKNFVYDFNVESLELMTGLPLLLAGLIYGLYNWIWYATHRLAAPTGTVALAAVMIILGFQLVLSAISLDLEAVPRTPINEGAIAFEEIFPQDK